MIDAPTLAKMRDRVVKLIPYQRQVRPSHPASFPPFVDGELQRLSTSSRDVAQVLMDLDARLTALGG